MYRFHLDLDLTDLSLYVTQDLECVVIHAIGFILLCRSCFVSVAALRDLFIHFVRWHWWKIPKGIAPNYISESLQKSDGLPGVALKMKQTSEAWSRLLVVAGFSAHPDSDREPNCTAKLIRRLDVRGIYFCICILYGLRESTLWIDVCLRMYCVDWMCLFSGTSCISAALFCLSNSFSFLWTKLLEMTQLLWLDRISPRGLSVKLKSLHGIALPDGFVSNILI